jgi:hypothetical protein
MKTCVEHNSYEAVDKEMQDSNKVEGSMIYATCSMLNHFIPNLEDV